MYIMFNLKIKVNEKWLKYFKQRLDKKTNIKYIIRDAYYLKNFIKNKLNKKSEKLYNILEKLFWFFDDNIIIEIFPSFFYIWAINVEKKLILIWQPSHTKNFYIALLWHELSHLLLAKHKINRFIEEIICFMFEKKILFLFDNVDLEDFLFFKNVDEFHIKAIQYAHKFYFDFEVYYNKKDLWWLINFLEKNVNINDLNIEIEKNLISYLNKINE